MIFDVQVLCQTPKTTVFRVTDLLRFLEASGQAHLIPAEYQQWARNCDEYIIMGSGIESGIVQMIPWVEIRCAPIINYPFGDAYTLSTYEQFRDNLMDGRPYTEYKEACKMVVLSAKKIAGQKAEDIEFVQHLVNLVLKPGLWFWGIKVSGGDTEIWEGCEELLGDGIAAKLSQVSV